MASEMLVLLEKATSPLLLEIDIPITLQIVDLIRQNDVSGKVAVSSIYQRLKDKNPNVVLMTLQVLEYVVKNCGEAVHEEVCSRSSCEMLDELIRTNSNEEVRSAACYLLGSWCSAFKGNTKLTAVQDLANILRAKGLNIPASSEAAALYSADAAPDWADASCCHRCRTAFSLMKRKHHCRACGQVFCHDCSSRVSNIPKFGIEREVRVCETCYCQINSPNQSKPKNKDDSAVTPATKPSSGSGGAEPATGGGKSEEELREEEELQLALALSKSEAENKEKEKLRVTSSLLGGGGWRGSAPPHSPSPPPISNTPQHQQAHSGEEETGELAKYLNRSYWEEQQQKQSTVTNGVSGGVKNNNGGYKSILEDTSGADDIAITSPTYATVAKVNETLQTTSSADPEMDTFIATFRTQLDVLVNRLKSNQSRGRPIANDTAVQSLFVNVTTMHGQLLQHLQNMDHKRVYYEELQDKLSQSRDARAALEALREEHRDKERRIREEQHRVRQVQMQQKLEVMRKKKQEYLEYQRQLAVHRMAQTERQLMPHTMHHMGYYGPPQPGTLPHPGAPQGGMDPQQPYPPPPAVMGGYQDPSPLPPHMQQPPQYMPQQPMPAPYNMPPPQHPAGVPGAAAGPPDVTMIPQQPAPPPPMMMPPQHQPQPPIMQAMPAMPIPGGIPPPQPQPQQQQPQPEEPQQQQTELICFD